MQISQIALFLSMSLMISCASLQQKSDRAIKRCTQYLAKQPFRYDYVYLYSYLQHQNSEFLLNIPQQEQIDSYLDSLSKIESSETELHPALRYARLAKKETILPDFRFLDNLPEEGSDAVTLHALYCDKKPLDSIFFKKLHNEALAGDYQRSHALLSLILAKKHGCIDSLTQTEKEIETLILQLNQQSISNSPKEMNWTDLEIETIALLQAYGQPVSKDYLTTIIDLQHPDGGWGLDKKKTESNTHTAILALWALLPIVQNK